MRLEYSIVNIGATVVIGLAVSACGASDSLSSEESMGEAVGSGSPQPLVEVDSGGAKVAFLELAMNSGHSGIVYREVASSYASELPLDQLLPQRLTSLEIYAALTGDASGAPELLKTLHPVQARELGRDGEEVRQAAYDPHRIVEKTSGNCNAFAWAEPSWWQEQNYWTEKHYNTAAYNGYHIMYAHPFDGSTGWTPKWRDVVTALCNDGAPVATAKIDFSDDHGNQQHFEYNAGQYYGVRHIGHGIYPQRWSIYATSSAQQYFLRTAYSALQVNY